MNGLLDTQELYEWCGCKQKSRLELWLRKNGITYWISTNGTPITTLEAVNDSFKKSTSTDEFIFE